MTAPSDGFVDAAVGLLDALLAAVNDPADQIRLLLPLCAYSSPPLPGSGPLWQLASGIAAALDAAMRSTACGALAQAAAAYQPWSYQDAQAVRAAVCGALDAEATRAADAGRAASYEALRALHAAVALDLASRGADLAWLVTISTRQPTASLAEAWALYADTSREPELVGSAQPAHPGWLPTIFEALNR
jgi:prophage DNA circulation protein